MKKKTYSVSILTYILVSVLIFFVMFSSFLITGAYFSGNTIVQGTIQLAEIDFQILNSLSQVITEEPNLLMPDEVISNAISILNARDEAGLNTTNLIPIFIRIQPEFTLDSISHLEYLHIELYESTDWVQGTDGYLYYKYPLDMGEQVPFNTYFVLSYLINNSYQDASAYLGLNVDAVQVENLAYLDLWTTAPEEWKSIVDNYS